LATEVDAASKIDATSDEDEKRAERRSRTWKGCRWYTPGGP